MKRPLISALAFLIFGIVCGRYFYNHIGFVPFCAVLLLSVTALIFVKKIKIAAFFPLLAIIGFFSVQENIKDDYPFLTEAAQTQTPVIIAGIATQTGKTSSGRTKVTINTESVQLGDEIYTIKIKVLAYLDPNTRVSLGDRVEASGPLSELRFLRNPGGYDEFTYLRSRKIQYTFFPDFFEIKGSTFYPEKFLKFANEHFSSGLYKILPEEEAAIMSAIILGDRSGIDSETQNLYKDAGIIHILTVSGLHVSLIATALNNFMKVIKLNKRHADIMSLVFLITYCILTGSAVGTVRATFMSGVCFVASLLFRKSDTLNSCVFAAICLLLYEPLYLWDIGFQYSFIAVFGLILGTPVMSSFLDDIGNRAKFLTKVLSKAYLKSNIAGVFTATFATFPILAYHYGYLPLGGIIANFVIVPTVFFSTITGGAAGIMALFNVGAARIIGAAPYIVLRTYKLICETVISIPFSKIISGSMPIYMVFFCYAVLTLIIILKTMKAEDYKKFKGKIMIKLSIVLIFVGFVISGVLDNVTKVTILDVGQGDSIIISKGTMGIAIDGGGTYPGLSDIGNNTGVWNLMPYMTYLGIEKLEAAFVSHPDSDHATGIIETLLAGRIKRLIMYEQEPDEGGVYLTLIKAANESGTEIQYMKAGDSVILWNEVTIECIYPFEGMSDDSNNLSLVLKTTIQDVTFLFTGDMESKAERTMISSYIENFLDIDILKLAHHGSRTSTSQELLDVTTPQISLVSAGSRNVYGHPHPEVIERVLGAGSNTYSTVTEGAIIIYPKNGAVRIKTMAGNADERIERPFKIW